VALLKSIKVGRKLKSLIPSPSLEWLKNGDFSEPEASPKEFSIYTSHVKDLAYHGVGYRIECLPKAPQNPIEFLKLREAIAQTLKDETHTSPAYLKSNCYHPGQKSERDLSNPDSYNVVGKWIDENGQTRFYCEWKDGYGNDCSDDETGPLYEINDGDVNNADALLGKLDRMEVEGPPSASSSDLTIVSSNDDNVTEAVVESPSYMVKFANAERSLMKNSFFVSGLGIKKSGAIAKSESINGNGINSTVRTSSEVQSNLELIDLTDSP